MSVVSPQDRLAGAWNFSAVHSADADLPIGGRALSDDVELTAELEQRTTGEGTRVAELATQGRALRVWKPLPDDGRSRAIGLYRAADDTELETILASLPLRPWMEIAVTALAEHPNDPALKIGLAS